MSEEVAVLEPRTPLDGRDPSTPGRRRARGRRQVGWRLAAVWLGLFLLAALFADFLPLAEGMNASKALLEPSLARPNLFSRHPLGTDRHGLDLLAGVLYGGRVSLAIGVGGTVFAGLVGGGLGLVGGYYGGPVRRIVDFLCDSMMAVPPLILLMAMVAVLRPSIVNIAIGLGIVMTPIYMRLVRAHTLSIKRRGFITAARSLGASDGRIMRRELIPEMVMPVLTYAITAIATLIVAESALSFLGLGIARPSPTWGNMVAAGQADFDRHPHQVVVPGLTLVLTVLALNSIGDRLRSYWEPKGPVT